MPQRSDKYIVRLPEGMRERIKARALANRRSMNSEIIHYLDHALASIEATKSPATAATVPGSELNPTPARNEADEHLIA
jgi:plasmid stability protein